MLGVECRQDVVRMNGETEGTAQSNSEVDCELEERWEVVDVLKKQISLYAA